jgi:hypothetical protein
VTKYTHVIYKRTKGVPFPGDTWEECGSLAKARRVFKRNYKDEEGATGDNKNVFHIIRVTYTAVT